MRERRARPRSRVGSAGPAVSVGVSCVLVCALLLGESAVRAQDVTSVQIAAGAEMEDGILLDEPFYLDATVTVRGATAVTLTTPRGITIPLTRVSLRDWWVESDSYGSLGEIRDDPDLGFGNFRFQFEGPDGIDGVTLAFDPGSTPAFADYGQVFSPAHLETGVGFDADLFWWCYEFCADEDAWDVQLVDPLTGQWVRQAVLGPGAGYWDPGPLQPNATYVVWNHLQAVLGPGPQSRFTDGGDAFTYVPSWENLCTSRFFTAEAVEVDVSRTQVHWTVMSAATTGYDVVVGDLGALRGTDGDFSQAVTACAAENTFTPFLDLGASPDPGEAWWVLVRPVGSFGEGSWDSGYLSQPWSRDAGIDLDPDGCL